MPCNKPCPGGVPCLISLWSELEKDEQAALLAFGQSKRSNDGHRSHSCGPDCERLHKQEANG